MLPVYIVLIVFSFITLMVKWENDLKREKIQAKKEGSSLGTSELRGMIQEAMSEAIAPMEERLELMEMHMRQLPEHRSESTDNAVTHPDEPNE